MITHIFEKYQCEKCKTWYEKIEAAIQCESEPIKHDHGIQLGDEVQITRGEGSGSIGIVEKIIVFNMEWGHYAWKRYWHTVGLDVKIIGGYGNRLLTFDDYNQPIQAIAESLNFKVHPSHLVSRASAESSSDRPGCFYIPLRCSRG